MEARGSGDSGNRRRVEIIAILIHAAQGVGASDRSIFAMSRTRNSDTRARDEQRPFTMDIRDQEPMNSGSITADSELRRRQV